MVYRLRIDGDVFRDSSNREVTLHGINLAADAKLPLRPDVPSHEPSSFFDGDNVSFVGRPFSLDDAGIHFTRLRKWGFNTLRYIFTWEAIEHAGPGKYDEDFINHTVQVLRIAKSFGFYVFMDPHQDVWSRFTGGCGAPMWTLYACGLNPRTFLSTEAALVQNSWPDVAKFPKMIWATNYNRLACQTAYTLFWAGKEFAPNAIIDGVNIQDYLQSHFLNAIRRLAEQIKAAGDLDSNVVIAWESVNEPNRCLVGYQDISKIPAEQKLHKGTSPTPWQGILTGSGRACEIDTWDFGSMGPYKSGTQLVDPHGTSAWLPATHDDTKYGWKRDPKWKLGSCLWAQHGVWDPSTDVLLRPDHFSKDPATNQTIDYQYFTNKFFLRYYRSYRDMVRQLFPDTIMFCQGPVLEIPPLIKGTADDDPNMAFAPHWYDGVTLMNKKWNRYFNVDVFGVLRGKYLNPAFAVRFGESGIRNCFREQHSAIRDEGMQQMGKRPTVFTEFGIPYDMDDGYAYKTGDYSSQVRAMDANYFGMEGSKVGNILWNYTVTNSHKWGDQWNGEDLSIFSVDDRLLPPTPYAKTQSSHVNDIDSPSYSESQLADSVSNLSARKHDMRVTTNESRDSSLHGSTASTRGCRAAEAYVRPTAIATHGVLESYGFDLKKCRFHMKLIAPSSTPDDAPTEVYLPDFHFPKDSVDIHVSGGKWTLEHDRKEQGGMPRLRWWHAAGEQELSATGVVATKVSEEDSGYLSQCREQAEKCSVM